MDPRAINTISNGQPLIFTDRQQFTQGKLLLYVCMFIYMCVCVCTCVFQVTAFSKKKTQINLPLELENALKFPLLSKIIKSTTKTSE